MVNVGILGGAFDPPHRGHETCARFALSAPQRMDKVWVIPSGDRIDKPNQIAYEHRITMARLAFNDISSAVSVYAYESPSIRKGPVYTYDTVQLLTSRYNLWNFHLIVGEDNQNVMSWHEGKALLKLLTSVIVVPRDARSSTNVRNDIETMLPTLNPKVAQYVREQGLYK